MGVSFKEFAFSTMFWLKNAFWVLVSSFVVRILWPLFARISNERSEIRGVAANEVRQNPDDQNEATGELFGFDSGLQSRCEEENSFDFLSVSNAVTSKYEFLGGNSFCGYIEEPPRTSFKVQELFLDSPCDLGITGDSVTTKHSYRDFCEFDDQEVDEKGKIEVFACSKSSVNKDLGEVQDQVKTKVPVTGELSVVNVVKTDVSVCSELFPSADYGQVLDHGKTGGSVCCEPSLDEEFQQDDDNSGKESSIILSSNEEGVGSEPLNLSQEELSEQGEINGLQDCIGGRNEISVKNHVSCETSSEEEELISLCSNKLSQKADIFGFSYQVQPSWEDKLLSYDYFVQEASKASNDFWHTNGKFISGFDEIYCDQRAGEVLAPETPICIDTRSVGRYEEDDSTDSDDHQDSVMNHSEAEEEYWDKSEEQQMDEEYNQVLDEGDEMDLDVLLQHQLFVRKMKKEMKHSRTIGLPTILEESESPRLDEDLKPLKISEKVGYKDQLDEIQRFYRSYLDKMRRLDILCQQTMYALGFLQLKNQDQLTTNRKLSLHSMKSLLANNFWPKFRRHESDPMQKLLCDLHRDLELVYVGQLCLSWEILKWQHVKAEELQLFDTMGLRQYSLVAGEFQQFQVLVQRFTEDEPFHGPRVKNYVKNRCCNCNLLQVPPINDDSKNVEMKREEQELVSIGRLADIIEDSMHAFWEFVRADRKGVSNVRLHGDPLDAELLYDIRTNLAKKERRLKDLVRSGNCIVKKFQKRQDCRLSHEVLLAQVELRLVSRVIGMSRLTAEQLLWCHKKLGKISVVGRTVSIESSFLLFPC